MRRGNRQNWSVRAFPPNCHSQSGAAQDSTLIGNFLRLAADWTGSQWLLEPKGFHSGLVVLTTRFRNRAVHIDELGGEDYLGCRELVSWAPKGCFGSYSWQRNATNELKPW